MTTPGQAIRDALEPLGFAVLGDQLAQVLEAYFSADSQPLPESLDTVGYELEAAGLYYRPCQEHKDELLYAAAVAIKGLLLMVKQGV